MKQLFLFIALFFSAFNLANAQYFFFSQQHFSESPMNPAYVAASNYAGISAVHRNQQAAEDFNIKSTLISSWMPFINNQDKAWSGAGITFLDDRSGVSGTFRVQKISGQYAIRVPISPRQSLILGIQAGYESREFSLDGLFTGSQYIPGRGFGQALGSGESTEDFRQRSFTFGSGLLWQSADLDGNRIAELGLAIADLSGSLAGFFGGESVISPAGILHGKLHLTGPTAFSLDPFYRILLHAEGSLVQLGASWNYALSEQNSISLLTEYVAGRQGILGVMFNAGEFTFGVSYDVTMGKRPGNQGAVEFGLKHRWGRKRRNRLPRELRNLPPPIPIQGISYSEVEGTIKLVEPKSVDIDTGTPSKGRGDAGELEYHPFEYSDSVTLVLNYNLNEVEPIAGFEPVLSRIAEVVIKRNQSLVIVGHTDTSGAAEYNQQLSEQRAQFLRNRIIALGVDSELVTAEGRGESEPLPGAKPSENRRVMFILHK